jgi:hypothetical protein
MSPPQVVLLATYFTLVSRLAYSSTLKMEATCSSVTSVDFQRATRRYIPEDRTQNKFVFDSLPLRSCDFSPFLKIMKYLIVHSCIHSVSYVYLLAEMPGVARDLIRNKGTR